MELRQVTPLEEVIDAYHAAWTQPDRDERRRLLELSLTDDAELVQPTRRVFGRDGIGELISDFPARWPEAAIRQSSLGDEHHGFVCMVWRIQGVDGSTLQAGHDLGELAADGRLRRVVQFLTHAAGNP